MKDEAILVLTKEFKTEADLNDFSKVLKKFTVENALNAEFTEHLGYGKNGASTGKIHAMAIQPNPYLRMMVNLNWTRP